jgi:hypothetical protein
MKVLSKTTKTITVVVSVATHFGKRRFHDCSDKLYGLRHSFGLNEALYKRKAHRSGGAYDSIYSGISFRWFAKKQLW